MKKELTKIQSNLYHYKDGVKIEGKNENMSGNCSGLYGDCTGLSGYCTGLSGDLDNCDITDEDRKKGIDISELVK